MLRKYTKDIVIPGLLVYDILSVFVSAYTGLLIHFGGDASGMSSIDIFYFGAVCAAIIIISGIIFGCYYDIWERVGVYEIMRQIAAVSFSYILYQSVYWLHGLRIPAGALFISFFLMFFFSMSIRLMPRAVRWIDVNMKWTHNSAGNRVIIIGADDDGVSLARNLASKPQNGRIPVGYVDDNNKLWNSRIDGKPVFGGYEMLKSIIIRYRINEAIITARSIDKELVRDFFEKCKETKCRLMRYDVSNPYEESDFNNIKIREVSVEELLGRDPVDIKMDEIRDFIRGKVVLVTGGAGSIGSEICRQVLDLHCKKLIIFDFHENGLFDINTELMLKYRHMNFETVLGSIRDVESLDYVFYKYRPNIVFHAAAHKHVPLMEQNPFEAIKNNIIGTNNVSRKADEYKTDKFILISTDKAVNPSSIMGATKRIAELSVQVMNKKSETEFVAVRFGNVLGSNGSVIPLFKKQIAQGGPVTVTHPDMKRYFMTIPEAVKLVLEAGAIAKGGEIFMLDMGSPIRIYDLAVLLIQLSGLEPEKDIKIVFTGLRQGEKLSEELSMSYEDVSATSNEKIFVVKNNKYNYLKLQRQIMLIEDHVSQGNLEKAHAFVCELVPTYCYSDTDSNIMNISRIDLNQDHGQEYRAVSETPSDYK